MVTLDQAKQYLASVGVTLPDVMLQILVDQANSIEECLSLHYSPSVATLIQLYLLGLLGLASGDKYVSSETAPSGASRSYRYMSSADRWTSLSRLLAKLDPYNCSGALVPPSPFAVSFGFVKSFRGGCGHE